eukprot:m.83410 g.83410  ORF g.83410 m.83410 type:complete len:708 (+) comp11203_c0_seq2:90-2213(+)
MDPRPEDTALRSRAGTVMAMEGHVEAAKAALFRSTGGSERPREQSPARFLPLSAPPTRQASGQRASGSVYELIGQTVDGENDVLLPPLLTLRPGEPGGGPAALPRPMSMDVETVKQAHTAWNHVVGWRDAATLEWIDFCLRMAHRHKSYKHAALRVLARMATSGTHNGGRSCNSVLRKLKSVAKHMALELLPAMLQYRDEHNLKAVLGHIQTDFAEPPTLWKHHLICCDKCKVMPIVGPRYHSVGSDYDLCRACFTESDSSAATWEMVNKPGDGGVDVDRSASAGSVASIGSEADPSRIPTQNTKGATYLKQRDYLAFFDPKYTAAIQEGHVGLTPDLWYERGLICMLIIVSHYVQEVFGTQTERLGGERARHRLAPPKTYERMFTKSQADYADRPGPGAMYNKDPIRKSILSRTAVDQAIVWKDLISAGYSVLAVKNTFNYSDEQARDETQGMMQILVNIVFRPHLLDGSTLTFGAMLADTEGFQAAVRAARDSSGPGQRRSFDQAAILFSKLPDLDDQPIMLIAEIQLHLQFYLEQRKQTHLWFKIQRADELHDLAYDCVKYRNANEGLRTTNEALWSVWEKEEASVLDTSRWMIEVDDSDASAPIWTNVPQAISDALTNSFRAWKKGNARHRSSNLKMDGERCTFHLTTMTVDFQKGSRQIRAPTNIAEALTDPPPRSTGENKLSAFLRKSDGKAPDKSRSKKK